jgi:ribosome-binding ATPase YchF (GTP1/OBG family)
MSTDTQIEIIEEKLQALLTRYKRLQKENANLKEELHETSTQLAVHKKENEKLKQQIDVANIGTSNWSEDERSNLNKRIDSYLKEIEKCLEYLNS